MSKQRQHPYPMIRNGGLFLLLIGLGMVIGTLLGGSEPVQRPIFFIGTGLGITALFRLGDRLSYGPPTRGQIIALIMSIGLEVLLMVVLGFVLQNSSARDYWLWILLIVGIHFLPMAFAFGPLIAPSSS